LEGRDFLKIIRWPIDDALLRSPAVTNRNLFAEKVANLSPDKIIERYACMTPKGVANDFELIFKTVKSAEIDLCGSGVELGAGVGVLSSIAVNVWPSISEIYAVEVVPNIVTLLQPKCTQFIAPNKQEKIIGVIGSFDDIQVQDGTFDFCIEYASLHHSDNLLKTLKEASRILKQGAPLIAIDRAHINKATDIQLKYMLDVRYSSAWKIDNGYEMTALSRSENGEHEIRIQEWLEVFDLSGFDLVLHAEMRIVGWRQLFYKLSLMAPFFLRRLLDMNPTRVRPSFQEIQWITKNLIGINSSKKFFRSSKDHTVFVLKKR